VPQGGPPPPPSEPADLAETARSEALTLRRNRRDLRT
jgi:hypothetical protein